MSQAVSFTLRPLKAPDAAPARRLWSERFGGDPSTQTKWIEAALNPGHTAAGFVAVTFPDGEVVGVSFLDVGGPAYIREYLGLGELDLQVPFADRNGVFHLSCVRADWEGRGIGSAFYERRLAVLADRNVPRAVGIAWHRPADVDSRALFEKHGFTRLATVERYYSRTGTRPNCPRCTGTCLCTASLYDRAIA